MHYGKKKTEILTFKTVVIALILLLVGGYAVSKLMKAGPSNPDDRTQLARCLTDKGVKMYGAYWCPHCARQKEAFGPSFKYVHYVECAVPGNRREQTEICKKEGISGYPTWEFADGTRKSGELTLSDLARQAGCAYGDVQAESMDSGDAAKGDGTQSGDAMQGDGAQSGDATGGDAMNADDGTDSGNAADGGAMDDGTTTPAN